MNKHTITINEVKEHMKNGVTTFSRKNNSPRGCETVSASEIKIGDEIVIDNYFTEVVMSFQEFEKQYGHLLSWEDAEKKAGRKLDWNNNLDCGIHHDLLIEEARKNGIDVPTE